VKLTKAELPWQLVARAWLPAAQALDRRVALMELLRALPFTACVPFGREPDAEVGVWLRAASPAPLPDALLAQVGALLGLDVEADVLRYADATRGQTRAIRVTRAAATTHVGAFLLAGDTRAAGWIGELLQERLPADAYGRALLAGSAKPPVPVAARGAQVCSCFDVTAPQIDAALARFDGDLALVQEELKCGTNCGSCLPALKAMAKARATVAA
jgi:assimilatory nitrate reductase catalytic subunit